MKDDTIKLHPVRRKGSQTIIGYVWKSDGEWHAEHLTTGVSWACDSKKDAEAVLLSN